MFPMRTSSVFKSRWMALLWSAGIIWFAYDVAGSAPPAGNQVSNADQQTDVTGAPVTPEDESKIGDILKNL